MHKFVTYLDKYKDRSEIHYDEMADILYLTRLHFISNRLYEQSFSGSTTDYYTKYDTSIWNSPPPLLHEITMPKLIPIDKLVVKEKKTIDVKIGNFDDVLKLLEENAYSDEFEYNIDFKALVQIKDELIELNNMIGMTNFKNAILDQILYFVQNLHVGKDPDFKNTILCGPPGTGKTEIATILGKMYSKIGVLKNNVFKKVTRSDLIAGYLGQTAIKTKKVISECLGGCLFIDEAYSLANSERDDIYSKECLDTLCEAMSDNKENLMVIIAGYEDELYETFFKTNKGLESRFIWKFKIDEYSATELMRIYLKKVKDNEWQMDSDAGLEKWFVSKKDSFKHYGRDMELLFSHTKIAHGRRIYGQSADIRKKITLDDIENGYKKFLANSRTQKAPPVVFGLYT
jgi:SpoVK/Ycf46/Vps4 family AAA+-type ATPase